MQTKLYPFKNSQSLDYLTGDDVTNLEALGIVYEGGKPLVPLPPLEPTTEFLAYERGPTELRTKIIVDNVDRTLIAGPFVIVVNLIYGDEKYYVGYETVFNLMVSANCENCMVHRYMTFVFSLHNVSPDIVYGEGVVIDVEFRGRLVPGATLDLTAHFAAFEGDDD